LNIFHLRKVIASIHHYRFPQVKNESPLETRGFRALRLILGDLLACGFHLTYYRARQSLDSTRDHDILVNPYDPNYLFVPEHIY
jgi:hypothetical protein